MIDWNIARRVGGFASGDEPVWRTPPDLEDVAERCTALVYDYTGLVPATPLPPPEAIGRGAWIDANLTSMRVVMAPITDKTPTGMGPAGALLRGGAGFILGAQVGALAGYLSQRVLGQYDLVLLDADAPTRLLLVAPNLGKASRQLGATDEEMLTWVMLHEVTHALQFTGVPWLHSHLGGLLRSLLESAEMSLDMSQALKLPNAQDLRGIVETLRTGDVMSLVAGPEQRELVDRMQATMAVLEGHAEHVMDATGAAVLPELERLRAALDRRRTQQSGLAALINRLLGLDMKLRQYVLGKQFVDGVVAAAGHPGLDALFAAPEALPTLPELSEPNTWLARVEVPTVTS